MKITLLSAQCRYCLVNKKKDCELSWKKTNFGAPKIALEVEPILKTA